MLKQTMDEEVLERLAHKELLQEAKQARSRAETMGAAGWQKCPIPATNKRFLRNALLNTLEPKRKKSRPDNKQQEIKMKDPKPYRESNCKTTSFADKKRNKEKQKCKTISTTSAKSKQK
ncbi:hypothetical protein ABFA07_022485 [Porites harrisoni]